MLDELAAFGVRYSRLENMLFYGSTRAAAGVCSRDDIYARFQQLEPGKIFLAPGNWRGVLVVDLAQTCCALAGLGDPARGRHGTKSQFSAYLKALTEERHAERQVRAEDHNGPTSPS